MSKSLVILLSVFLCVACNKPDDTSIQDDEAGDTYFSIVDYAKDHWDTYEGQAYGMIKRVYFNGTEDSAYTNALQMDWAPVLKAFFETDISDRKFLERYNFSSFHDNTTHTNNFFYDAKESGLYTQKLHISANDRNNKIVSIYIEALKDDRLGTKTVKLLYTPLETISIQELETSKTGKRKELRVVYEFM